MLFIIIYLINVIFINSKHSKTIELKFSNFKNNLYVKQIDYKILVQIVNTKDIEKIG